MLILSSVLEVFVLVFDENFDVLVFVLVFDENLDEY